MRPLRSILLGVCLLCASESWSAEAIAFWDQPQRGANSFNGKAPDEAYFRALRTYGATWVRLAYDKWPSTGRDFLLRNADDYERLDAADLETLLNAIDRAHAAGLKVVVAPLSLPGARWRQLNGNKLDDRLWTNKVYWEQSAGFWRDLAIALRGHPAVVAYNLLNEPSPERLGGLEEGAAPEIKQAWYARHRGSARDLQAFYALLIQAIRAVDEHTPIMVDSGFHAAASAYRYWPVPFEDSSVLYAYHMYEPWVATSARNLKREKPYVYPGVVPFGDREEHWNAERVAEELRQPLDWAREHGVPRTRLVAAEFGCMRRWESCPRYLDDVLSVLEADGVHWAFYAFREDVWEGMDYELGAEKVPWQYWDAVEAGQTYELQRGPNPVFEPISKRLATGAR